MRIKLWVFWLAKTDNKIHELIKNGNIKVFFCKLINRLFATLILITFLTSPSIAKNIDIEEAAPKYKKENKFSINTGSFIYHFYNPGENNYTELFDNKYFSAGINIFRGLDLSIGTFKNSYGDRCAMIGVEKNWHDFNKKTSFEGFYSYAGEFFFKSFRNCKNQGVYKNFRNSVGIGFAPYIYHGVEYKVTNNMSLKGGIIVPGLFTSTIHWSF